jgi:large subunit ribosomal protein L29
MKSTDYLKQLRAKSADQLGEELASLQKEQFNLRLQASTGQQSKSHLASDNRKKIARVQTMLKLQAKS